MLGVSHRYRHINLLELLNLEVTVIYANIVGGDEGARIVKKKISSRYH